MNTNPYRVGERVKLTYPSPKYILLKGQYFTVQSQKDNQVTCLQDGVIFYFEWGELTISRTTSPK